MQLSSIQLYTKKAGNYARFRPEYAPEAISAFVDAAELTHDSVVVDIGSGTGLLTRHLLDHFDTVYAVEPTLEMRQIAEGDLSGRNGFNSVAAQAENTTLPESTAQVIAVGQAIHWFNPELALPEFQRISTPGTWLLLTNIKSTDESLNQALDTIFTADHGLLPKANQPHSDLVPKDYYFREGKYTTTQFPHSMNESWESFLGGIGTAAFAPDEDNPGYPDFVDATRQVFNQFSSHGVLTWHIATETSFGYLAEETR